MSKIKQSLCIFKLQVEECFHSPKYIIAILLQIAQVVYYTLKYKNYAINMGEPVNIFDGYFCATSSVYTLTIMFLIFIFAVSDIPFVNKMTYQELIRTDREELIAGKISFVCFSALLLQLISVMTSVIILAPEAFKNNVWSFPFYQLSIYNGALAQSLEYTGVNALYYYSPLQVASLQIILNTLFMASQGLVLFLLSLFTKKVIAYSITMAAHVIGFFMNAYNSVQLFPFPHTVISSMYSQDCNGCGIKASVIYLLFLLIIVSAVIIIMADRSELGTTTVTIEE